MPAGVRPLPWLKFSTVKSDFISMLIARGNKFIMHVPEKVGGEHEEVCWQQSLWLSCAG